MLPANDSPGQENSIKWGGFLKEDAKVFETGTLKITTIDVGKKFMNKKTGMESILWKRVKVFNSETAQGLRAGDKVTIEGRLNANSYVGKDGKNKTFEEVIANTIKKHSAYSKEEKAMESSLNPGFDEFAKPAEIPDFDIPIPF